MRVCVCVCVHNCVMLVCVRCVFGHVVHRYLADYTVALNGAPGSEADGVANSAAAAAADTSQDVRVERYVSHIRQLAGPMDHQRAIEARRLHNPDIESVHHRRATSVVRPTPHGFALVSSHSRAVHGLSDDDSPKHTSSGFAKRHSKQAAAEHAGRPNQEAEQAMKEPPIQYVETASRLVAQRTLSDTEEFPIPSFAPGRRLAEGDAAAAAPKPVVERAVRVPERAKRDILGRVPNSKAAAQVRDQARAFLDAGVVAETVQSHDVPRRLLEQQDAEDGAQLVLHAVSLTSHFPTLGLSDVPGGHLDRSGLAHPTLEEEHTIEFYVACADNADDDARRRVSAKCFQDFAIQARRDDAMRNALVRYLAPEELEELHTRFAHAAPMLMGVASSVGTRDCQEALAKLLLSIDYEVPEMKTFKDSHDFFHVVNALSMLKDPLPLVFDAMHTSMEHHAAHADQYHQLLLALGALGRALPDAHPQRARVLQTLHSRFDEMAAVNAEAEAVFATYLQRADTELAAMTEEHRHTWMAKCNHVERLDWEETWRTATEADRAEFVETTRVAVARMLADNDDLDDGSGVRGNYGRRRFLNDMKSLQEAGVVDPTMAAVVDVLHVQAPELRYTVQAMANLGHPESGERLLALAQHRMTSVRAFATHALKSFPTPQARRVLLDTMLNEAENTRLRTTAVDALGEWPQQHLDEGADDVMDAVLTHLSRNDGVDWIRCDIDCADTCQQRDMAMCHRACARKCGAMKELEQAVVALAHFRYGVVTDDVVSEEDRRDAVRRLSQMPDDEAQKDHPRVRGARRLYKTLEELEEILSYTKFHFRAGFVETWRLDIGKRALVAAFIGAGSTNTFEINIGLFSGFFEIIVDNWAAASLFVLGFELSFIELKIAFNAGVSYTNDLASQAVSSANTYLGNNVRAVRSRDGRTVGFMTRFSERLDEIVKPTIEYATKVDTFLTVSDKLSVLTTAIVDVLTTELVEQNSLASVLLARSDTAGASVVLAGDTYDATDKLIAPDSTLNRVLELADEIASFKSVLNDMSFEVNRALTSTNSDVQLLSTLVPRAVRVIQPPLASVASALESFVEAQAELPESIAAIDAYVSATAGLDTAAQELAENHVDVFHAALPRVQEQIVNIQTVVDTITAASGGASVDIESMRASLLSYLRALAPQTKKHIVSEVAESGARLFDAVALASVASLNAINVSASLDASLDGASAVIGSLPAAVASVESQAATNAAFLGSVASAAKPLDAAIGAALQYPALDINSTLSQWDFHLSRFVAGLAHPSSALAASASAVSNEMRSVLDTLGVEVLPATWEALAVRELESMKWTADAAGPVVSRGFKDLGWTWDAVQPALQDLLLPVFVHKLANASEVATEVAVASGIPSHPLARAIVETTEQVSVSATTFLTQLSEAATITLQQLKDDLSGTRVTLGSQGRPSVSSAVEESVSRVESGFAGGSAAAAWIDTLSLLESLNGSPEVAVFVASMDDAVSALAIEVSRSSFRSLRANIEGAVDAAIMLEDEAAINGQTLTEEETDVHSILRSLLESIVTVEHHVLLSGVYNGWVEDIIANGADQKITDSIQHISALVSTRFQNFEDELLGSYFAGGLQGLWKRLSLAQLEEVLNRMEWFAQASAPLARLFFALETDGGLASASGSDPYYLSLAHPLVVDGAMMHNVTTYVRGNFSSELRSSYMSFALLAKQFSSMDDRSSLVSDLSSAAMFCSTEIVDEAASPTDPIVLALRELYAAAAAASHEAQVDHVHGNSARRLAFAASMFMMRSEASAISFDSRQCSLMVKTLNTVVPASVRSVASMLTTLYPHAARIAFDETIATYHSVVASSASDVTVMEAADEVLTDALVGANLMSEPESGWFHRQLTVMENRASALNTEALATQVAVANMSTEDHRVNPIHPNITHALGCVYNTTTALLAGLPQIIGSSAGALYPDEATLSLMSFEELLSLMVASERAMTTCADSAELEKVVIGDSDPQQPVKCGNSSSTVFEPGEKCTSTRDPTYVPEPSKFLFRCPPGHLPTPTGPCYTECAIAARNVSAPDCNCTQCTMEEIPHEVPMIVECKPAIIERVRTDGDCYPYLTLGETASRAGALQFAERLEEFLIFTRQLEARLLSHWRTRPLHDVASTVSAFHSVSVALRAVDAALETPPARPRALLLAAEVRQATLGGRAMTVSRLQAAFGAQSPGFMYTLRGALQGLESAASEAADASVTPAAAATALQDLVDGTTAVQHIVDAFILDRPRDPFMALAVFGRTNTMKLLGLLGGMVRAQATYATERDGADAQVDAAWDRFVSVARALSPAFPADINLDDVWGGVTAIVDARVCFQDAYHRATSVFPELLASSPLATDMSMASRQEWIEATISSAVCVGAADGVDVRDFHGGLRILNSALSALSTLQNVPEGDATDLQADWIAHNATVTGVLDFLGQEASWLLQHVSTDDYSTLRDLLATMVDSLADAVHDDTARLQTWSHPLMNDEDSQESPVVLAVGYATDAIAAARVELPKSGTGIEALRAIRVLSNLNAVGEGLRLIVRVAAADPDRELSPRDPTTTGSRVARTASTLLASYTSALSSLPFIPLGHSEFAMACEELRQSYMLGELFEPMTALRGHTAPFNITLPTLSQHLPTLAASIEAVADSVAPVVLFRAFRAAWNAVNATASGLAPEQTGRNVTAALADFAAWQESLPVRVPTPLTAVSTSTRRKLAAAAERLAAVAANLGNSTEHVHVTAPLLAAARRLDASLRLTSLASTLHVLYDAARVAVAHQGAVQRLEHVLDTAMAAAPQIVDSADAAERTVALEPFVGAVQAATDAAQAVWVKPLELVNASTMELGFGGFRAVSHAAQQVNTTLSSFGSVCTDLFMARQTIPQACCFELELEGMRTADCAAAVDCAVLRLDASATLPQSCCAEVFALGETHPSCGTPLDCAAFVDWTSDSGPHVDPDAALPVACCAHPLVARHVSSHPTCESESVAWPDKRWSPVVAPVTTCDRDCIRCAVSRLRVPEFAGSSLEPVRNRTTHHQSLGLQSPAMLEEGVYSPAVRGQSTLAYVSDAVRSFSELVDAVEETSLAEKPDMVRVVAALTDTVGILRRGGSALSYYGCARQKGYGKWLMALELLESWQLDFIADGVYRGYISSEAEAMAAFAPQVKAQPTAVERRLFSEAIVIAWEVASSTASGQPVSARAAALLGSRASGTCGQHYDNVTRSDDDMQELLSDEDQQECTVYTQLAFLRDSIQALAPSTTHVPSQLVASAQSVALTLSVIRSLVAADKAAFGTGVATTDAATLLSIANDTYVARGAIAASIRASAGPLRMKALAVDSATPTELLPVAVTDTGVDTHLALDAARVPILADAASADFFFLAQSLGGASDVTTVVQQVVDAHALRGLRRGLALDQVGVASLDALQSRLASMESDIMALPSAVRTHSALIQHSMLSPDKHAAWARGLAMATRLAVFVRRAAHATGLVEVFESLQGLSSHLNDVATSTSTTPMQGSSDAATWLAFARTELPGEVTASYVAFSASMFRAVAQSGPVGASALMWLRSACRDVLQHLRGLEDHASACLVGCPTVSERQFWARLVEYGTRAEAGGMKMQRALDVTTRDTPAHQASLGGVALAVEGVQDLHSGLASLFTSWYAMSDDTVSRLRLLGVFEESDEAMRVLIAATESLVGLGSSEATLLSRFERISFPLDMDASMSSIASTSPTATLEPPACADIVPAASTVPALVTAHKSLLLSALSSVPTSVAAPLVDALNGAGGYEVGPYSPAEWLLALHSDLVSVRQNGDTAARDVVSEVAVLVDVALSTATCEDISLIVAANQEVQDDIAAFDAVSASSGDLSALRVAVRSGLMTVNASRVALSEPVVLAWAQRGAMRLSSSGQAGAKLLEVIAADETLSALRGCSLDDVLESKCTTAPTVATPAALTLLQVSIQMLLDSMSAELVGTLPLNGHLAANNTDGVVDQNGNLLGVESVSGGMIADVAVSLALAMSSGTQVRHAMRLAKAAGVDAFDPIAESLDTLLLQLHHQHVSRGYVQASLPLWSMPIMQQLLETTTLVEQVATSLQSALASGLAVSSPATLDALAEDADAVIARVRAGATAGTIPSHAVVSVLRLELATALVQTATTTQRARMVDVDALLRPLTSAGSMENLVPSQITNLQTALAALLDDSGGLSPVLVAATATLHSTMRSMQLLVELMAARAAVEVVVDANAVSDTRALPMESLLAGQNPMFQRLEAQAAAVAAPLLVTALSIADGLVDELAAAIPAAVDAVDQLTLPTVALGSFSGPSPWVARRAQLLVPTLTSLSGAISDLDSNLRAVATERGWMTSSADFVPTQEQVELLVPAVLHDAVRVLVGAKEASALVEYLQPYFVGATVPSAVDSAVLSLVRVFSVRCLGSCLADAQVGRRVWAMSRLFSITGDVQGLLTSVSLDNLLANGVPTFQAGATAIAMTLRRDDLSWVGPDPTASDFSVLLRAAAADVVAGLGDGSVASSQAGAEVDSALDDLVAALTAVSDGITTFTSLHEDYVGTLHLLSALSTARIAMAKAQQHGLDLGVAESSARDAGDAARANALLVVRSWLPIMHEWALHRCGGAASAHFSSAATQSGLLGMVLDTVTLMADMAITEFPALAPPLAAELVGATMDFPANNTVAELRDVELEVVTSSVKSLLLAVDSASVAVGTVDAGLQQAVMDAYVQAEDVEAMIALNVSIGFKVPLTSPRDYANTTATTYDNLLTELTSLKNSLAHALWLDDAEGRSASAQLPASVRSSFEAVLSELSSVATLRTDTGARQVTFASLELVTMLRSIVEVYELIEAGAHTTVINRVASAAVAELEERLRDAVLVQVRDIVSTFSDFVQFSVAKFGGGSSSRLFNQSSLDGADANAASPGDAAQALHTLEQYVTGIQSFIATPVVHMNDAVTRVMDATVQAHRFDSAIAGAGIVHTAVLQKHFNLAQQLHVDVSAFVERARGFGAFAARLESTADQVATLVVTGLQNDISGLVASMDSLVSELGNTRSNVVERMVPTAEAVETMRDAVKALRKAVTSRSLDTIQSSLDTLEAFFERDTMDIDTWRGVANLAKEAAEHLLPYTADIGLKKMPKIFMSVLAGVQFVNEQMRALNFVRKAASNIVDMLHKVHKWTTDFLAGVPDANASIELMESYLESLADIQADGFLFASQMYEAATQVSAITVKGVLESLNKNLAEVQLSLRNVEEVIEIARPHVESAIDLVDRRTYLRERMTSVLEHLAVPQAAITSIRALDTRLLHGSDEENQPDEEEDEGEEVVAGVRRLAPVDECSADFVAVTQMNFGDLVSDAKGVLSSLHSSLTDMNKLRLELASLVSIATAQTCVEGAMCAVVTLGTRLQDMVDLLRQFDLGFSSLATLRVAAPEFADSIDTTVACLSTVPSSLQQVQSFATEFMSGQLAANTGPSMAEVLQNAQQLTTPTNMLSEVVQESLGTFSTNIDAIGDAVVAGSDQLDAMVVVTNSGRRWLASLQPLQPVVQSIRSRMSEYVSSIADLETMQSKFDELNDLGDTLRRIRVVRSPVGWEDIQTLGNELIELMRDGAAKVAKLVVDIDNAADALAAKAGLGLLDTDFPKWSKVRTCNDPSLPEGVCLHQIARSSDVYRNFRYPAMYTQFWYETIAPFNMPNRMGRATIPGLFQSYIPKGIAIFDEETFIISLQPVGDLAGRPSVIARLEKEAKGRLMRVYTLWEKDGVTPHTGAVGDVTVSMSHVYTCDDTYNETKYGHLPNNRNDQIFAFESNDFFGGRGPPMKVVMAASYHTEVKPSGLTYDLQKHDELWVTEYHEPVKLELDGTESEDQGLTEYGSGSALSHKKRKGRGKKRSKKPKTINTAANQEVRTRSIASILTFLPPEDEIPIAQLKVDAEHYVATYEQYGWAVMYQLGANDDLPTAIKTDKLSGKNVLIPDLAVYVGEGVTGAFKASQLGNDYFLIQRCSLTEGYNCRLEVHDISDHSTENSNIKPYWVGGGPTSFDVMILDPGTPAEYEGVYVPSEDGGEDDKAPKKPDTDAKSQDAHARKGDVRRTRQKRRKGTQQRSKKNAADKNAKKKGSGKKPDTSVQMRNLGDEGTIVSAIMLPNGAMSIGYNNNAFENGMMFLFGGASQPFHEYFMEIGGDVEDSAHFMSMPALATIPPSIVENQMYVELLGMYKVYPRCVLPIGDKCKKSKEAAEDSETKDGGRQKPKKKSRKLAADTAVVKPTPEEIEVGLVPMSRTSQAIQTWAFDQAGAIPPWGEDQPSRGAIVRRGGHVTAFSRGQRRLETRGEAYADPSKCVAADVPIIVETPITLFEYSSIIMVGPVPLTITVDFSLVYSLSITVTVCISDKTVVVTLIPGAALEASLFGGLEIPYFARAGILLTVRLMDTLLNPSGSLSFKTGTSVCLAMDLELTPITITLAGTLSFFICIKFCEVRALMVGIAVFASVNVALVFAVMLQGVWKEGVHSHTVWVEVLPGLHSRHLGVVDGFHFQEPVRDQLCRSAGHNCSLQFCFCVFVLCMACSAASLFATPRQIAPHQLSMTPM